MYSYGQISIILGIIIVNIAGYVYTQNSSDQITQVAFNALEKNLIELQDAVAHAKPTEGSDLLDLILKRRDNLRKPKESTKPEESREPAGPSKLKESSSNPESIAGDFAKMWGGALTGKQTELPGKELRPGESSPVLSAEELFNEAEKKINSNLKELLASQEALKNKIGKNELSLLSQKSEWQALLRLTEALRGQIDSDLNSLANIVIPKPVSREKENIDKYNKLFKPYKDRITSLEQAVNDLQESVRSSLLTVNKRIEFLRKEYEQKKKQVLGLLKTYDVTRSSNIIVFLQEMEQALPVDDAETLDKLLQAYAQYRDDIQLYHSVATNKKIDTNMMGTLTRRLNSVKTAPVSEKQENIGRLEKLLKQLLGISDLAQQTKKFIEDMLKQISTADDTSYVEKILSGRRKSVEGDDDDNNGDDDWD